MDQSLYLLYAEGKIDEETALAYAESRSNMRLQMRLSGISPHASIDTSINS